jgi:transcriptional regulator with XRE-family HTH domain
MKKNDLKAEYKIFCAFLKHVRRERNIRQVEVALKLQKPQSYVSKIESGERRVDFVELRYLCKIYGISVEHFEKQFEHFRKKVR